jgi:hypothetical protein
MLVQDHREEEGAEEEVVDEVGVLREEQVEELGLDLVPRREYQK